MPKKRSTKNLGTHKKKVAKKFWGCLKKGRQKNLGTHKKKVVKKFWGYLKKRSSKKFGDICPKNNDFRHISEIYRLQQPSF